MKYLFCFFVLFPQAINRDHWDFVVIWNVGQGSMSSYITPTQCVHVDMGGENFPQKLIENCRGKDNFLYLTHFDWDHINFVNKTYRQLDSLCLATSLPNHLKPKKIYWLSKLRHCSQSSKGIIQLQTSQFKKSNESHVYLLAEKVLITGDDPQYEEKLLVPHLEKYKNKIRYLVAGHHGSRTSTSGALLRSLVHLRMVLISARKKRYGHPHKEVLEKLKKMAVPGVNTESYGHLYIYSGN